MITKMGKKAWDFLTQGKITDEWFDTDTVTVNGVVVNRENYGSSTYYKQEWQYENRFKILERQAFLSPMYTSISDAALYDQLFPYRISMLVRNNQNYDAKNFACNPFIYGKDSDGYTRSVFFGASDAPENEDHYWLQDWLQGVYCYTYSRNEVKKDNVTVEKLAIYNSTENEVTIKEMCACVKYLWITNANGGPTTVSTSTGMTEAAAPLIMIDRTVLETPLVIPAKSLGTLILK